MKFGRLAELEQFITEKQMFPGFCGITEIYTGGSSFNFYVKVNTGRESGFLLKLLADFEAWQKLSTILSSQEKLHRLPYDKFAEYYLLAMPYIEGRKLKNTDFTPFLFKGLLQEYTDMQNLKNEEVYMVAGKPYNLIQMTEKISERLNPRDDIFSCLINKYFFSPILSELVCLEKSSDLIHGDLTANNILIDKQKKVHLLDYGNVRFGHPIEDFAGLVLQVSGFRGMFGSLKRFQKLRKIIDDKKDWNHNIWLYGVQMFYLHTLYRRLGNTKKRKNLRKNFCLFLNLLGYFRLSKLLHQSK